MKRIKNKILRTFLLLLLLSFSWLDVIAQNELTDSTKQTINLSEVIIQGKQTVEKTNRESFLPNDIQKKTAHNGLELLGIIAIRGLAVNPITKNVSKINGGTIQLRINNVRATPEQVAVLRPERILKIEYFDTPVGQYGDENVEGVINYITLQLHSGGYVDVSSLVAVNAGFSNETASLKLNTQHAEFGFDYLFSHRKYRDNIQNSVNLFKYPNGDTYTRIDKSMPSPLKYQEHQISLYYQFQIPHKILLNVKLSDDFYRKSLYAIHSMESNTSNSNTYPTNYSAIVPYDKPVLDIYFQKKITPKQTLDINVVATAMKQHGIYNFSQTMNGDTLVDYNTEIAGNKKSLISEIKYSYLIGNAELDFGFKHFQAYATSTYSGSALGESKINQANSYAYGQFSSSVSNLTYNVTLGLYRTDFTDGQNSAIYYHWQPSVFVKWAINDHHILTNRFRVVTKNPSLYGLNNIPQPIDSLQIYQGNPNLKPYNTYSDAINYTYTIRKWSLNSEISYHYSKNPIMEIYSYENNKFITSSENLKSWRQYKLECQLTIPPLWKFVQLSIGGGSTLQESDGVDYSQHLHTYYGFANASFQYGHLSFAGNFNTQSKTLWGATISTSAPSSTVALQYEIGNWTVATFIMNILGHGKYNLSRTETPLVSSFQESAIGDNWNMFGVGLEYSFSFGKKAQSITKDLENSDNDTNLMKTTQ